MLNMGGSVDQGGKEVFSSILMVTFVLMSSATVLFQEQTSEESYSSGQIKLKKFASYAELENFVGARPRIVAYEGYEDIALMGWGSRAAMSVPAGSSDSDYVRYRIGYSNDQEHSTTNVQVEGVDEADIVKTDGRYLYVVSNERLLILTAYPPEEAKILSEIELDTRPLGIYVNDDRLVVFAGGYGSYSLQPEMVPRPYWWHPSETVIKIYDISDKSNTSLLNEITFSGNYFNSRMIGGYVYVVVNAPLEYADNRISLPEVSTHGNRETIPATEIYYFDNLRPPYVFTIITAIDIQSGEEAAEKVFLMNATHNMYVSLTNMYVSYTEAGKTIIHKISINNGEITYKAQGEVPGHLLNQFSLDEHRGYLRVATTTGWMHHNNVYVLDESLNVIGRLENLAPREKIYSARFMGDRAYLVTFKKVDPLFVIDLENPPNPKVLGKLKIPGYSDYLHPYDETHLIGVGKDTVDMGSFAWYQGVKIALFDVSDPENPKVISKYVIGDRGTDSYVLRDHKSFLFSRSKNLLVLPILLAEIDENKYPGGVPPYARGEKVWQGAYVFNISIEDGLTLRGRITHLENTQLNPSYYIKRSIYIEDVLYTVSEKMIKMNDLKSLEEIGRVSLYPPMKLR